MSDRRKWRRRGNVCLRGHRGGQDRHRSDSGNAGLKRYNQLIPLAPSRKPGAN